MTVGVPLRVSLSWECFAGHAAFTLAVVKSQVPVLRSREITHDRRLDVLAGFPIPLEGICLGIMVAMHFGIQGQSLPWPEGQGADENVSAWPA